MFKNLIIGCILIHGVFIIFAEGIEKPSNIADIVSRSYEAKNESWQLGLQNFDMRYSTLPAKCGNYSKPKDCTDATSCTNRSGIYMIENYNSDPYYVECDVDTDNGDWLVIQRRQDGSVDFYRNWIEYEQGFGNIDGEYFIGLKKLYALTNFNGPQELIIIMDDYNLTSKYAKYDNFLIGDANDSYKLKSLGKYSGTAGDALQYQVNMKFSTWDRDNDSHATLNCAEAMHGAWWYTGCGYSNLNGRYQNQLSTASVTWYQFEYSYNALRYVKMMIRRRKV